MNLCVYKANTVIIIVIVAVDIIMIVRC